jgi:hypothetical protein
MKNKSQPYTTYVFRQTDPILDELRGVVLDSGLKLSQIAECGVSTSTMYNWFRRPGSNRRRTRRPQFATISAVALACGADGIKFVDGKPVLIVPKRTPKLRVVK